MSWVETFAMVALVGGSLLAQFVLLILLWGLLVLLRTAKERLRKAWVRGK